MNKASIAEPQKSFRHSLKLASVDLYPVRAAGGISPAMTLGTMPTRPALLLRIEESNGCVGWGEVWANFPPRANIHKAQLIEDVITPRLLDASFTDPQEIDVLLRESLATYFLHIGQKEVFEHLLAGIDTALWDLTLRHAGYSFAAHMGLAQARAASYASSINTPDLERLMPLHAKCGQSHFKLKIGFNADKDLAFVQKASDLKPACTHLMIDSNQSWTRSQAERRLSELEAFEVSFAEEPIPADSPLSEWETLARATPIPLAGGENIYGADNFLRMADAGMKYLQPDVAKWGGVSGALALAKALPDDTFLWPHFMGTAIGQMAALSIAAAIGDTSVCEMDVNNNALRTDLCGDVLSIQNGYVRLPKEPGLVVPPLPDKLAAFTEPY